VAEQDGNILERVNVPQKNKVNMMGLLDKLKRKDPLTEKQREELKKLEQKEYYKGLKKRAKQESYQKGLRKPRSRFAGIGAGLDALDIGMTRMNKVLLGNDNIMGRSQSTKPRSRSTKGKSTTINVDGKTIRISEPKPRQKKKKEKKSDPYDIIFG